MAVDIRQKIQENDELQTIALKLDESEKLSELIHEFQIERSRMIAAYYGDSSFLVRAKQQQLITDAAEKNLRLFLQDANLSFAEISLMDELKNYRVDQDQADLDIEEFQRYSKHLIAAFLSKIQANVENFRNLEVRKKITGFKSLIDTKIHLGKIRGVLMQVTQENKFSFQAYAEYSVNRTLFNSSLEEFNKYAFGEASQKVLDLTNSENHINLTTLLLFLDENPDADLTNFNQHDIYYLFSKSQNDFKIAENLVITNIKNQVKKESNLKEHAFSSLILLVVIILGVAISYSLYIIRFLSSSLSRLRFAAERVKSGHNDVIISLTSTDEIGRLADSFRGVVRKNSLLTKVAEAIGDENYDVEVEVQGPEDSLSYAILQMKENLARFSRQNADRNWILTGSSAFNQLISQEKEILPFTENLISFICNYSKSELGILYLHNESSELEPITFFGIKKDSGKLPSFTIGEGKVGQAAAENKVEIFEGVEEEHMRIKTGLSEMIPANIIILPLVFNDVIIGAIELCSRRKYSAQSLEFLKTVAEKTALFVHTLQSHLQTQELLYQTQNQAEELETQQEELRQMNGELKASEEELRVNQEELQEKNAELEEKAQLLEEQFEAVGNKNKALEDAKDAIELKVQQVETVSKYKSEFLANMSHELRTPLNSILILSRLLADNPEKRLNSKQEEHAEIIHKSGADLLKLINEILDLSKIESGMIKLDIEKVNFDALGMENTFNELTSNKAIKFKVNYAKDLKSIETDKFRLEQILKNFLSNAIKFTDKGGFVTLDIYQVADRPQFKSELLQQQQEIVAFSVKDSGIGIAKDKQEVVFEAFQQADASTTRKYGGTGLGLAISRELADLLGGEIMLESELGKGSNFTLFLPKKNAKEITVNEKPNFSKTFESIEKSIDLSPNASRKEGKQISILIIEDDKGFSNILEDFAVSKNFKVSKAYEGNEGFELAKKIKPDAIMLDINLPDISGWDILKKIRGDKNIRHTNVHVMSAYDKDVTENNVGNEAYLSKPITLEKLNTAFNTISNLLENSIEKILIVEDNEVENNTIAELLRVHSMKSISAYSAEIAEDILAKQKVDFIILDLNLPGMHGYEWMKKVRSTEGLSNIPIIIYSAKDLNEDEEIRIKEFANTIIIKNEYSYLRLLDEVQLFLHKIDQKLPFGKEFQIKLHNSEQILKDKKVLIVDDDVRNVYSLSSLLELQGMEILVAYNGKEAINMLEKVKDIDIVLMDIMMPEMDGIEAITAIRKNHKFRDLPIIALTAKAMKEDRDKCIAAGASDYIPKPVDTNKLQTLMRVWLYEA